MLRNGISILIVDDDPELRNLIKDILEDQCFRVAVARDGKEALFARRRPIERRPMVLASVVHEMLDVVQERLKRQHVKLELKLDDIAPKVFVDSDQMRQVILNLVMNAIQAMNRVEPCVLLKNARTPRCICRSPIRGAGFPKKIFPNCSRRFSRPKKWEKARD